jgi:hypothetical protein
VPHARRRRPALVGLVLALVLSGLGALGASPAAAGSPEHCEASDPRTFVCDSYVSFVRRTPTPAEVEYWAPLIPAKKTFFLATLGRSAESRRVMIDAYYGYFAEVDPFEDEIDYWEGEVLKPNGFRRLEAALLAGVNFSVESFVLNAYGTLVGRTPSSAETTYWTGQVDLKGRNLVAADIAYSSEARRSRVYWAFQNELDYAPDDASWAYWAERVRTGTSYLDLRIGLKAAPDGYPEGSRICSTPAPELRYGCPL